MHTFHLQTTDVCLQFQMTVWVCAISVAIEKLDTMVGLFFCALWVVDRDSLWLQRQFSVLLFPCGRKDYILIPT